jgi:hypothetical protein
MQRSRHLVLPLTVFGLCFMIFPPLEVLMSTMPLRPGDVGWRFGTEGLLSSSILFPLIGMLMLMGAAVLRDSGTRARIMTWLSGAICLGIVALACAFLLDAIQLRSKVPLQSLPAFDRAAMFAVLRDAGALAVAIGFWVAARRIARDQPRGGFRGAVPASPTPIIGARSRTGESTAV